MTNEAGGTGAGLLRRDAATENWYYDFKDGVINPALGDASTLPTYGVPGVLIGTGTTTDHESYFDGISTETSSSSLNDTTEDDGLSVGSLSTGGSPIDQSEIFQIAWLRSRITDAEAQAISNQLSSVGTL